jgi:pimeloyl-ACP methyl ester carboxylesterase
MATDGLHRCRMLSDGTDGELKIEQAVDLHTALIDRTNVSFVQAGEGPALVLVHGGGSASSWQVWQQNIPALSQKYSVFVPDLPGFGSSDAAPVPISSEDDYYRYYPRFVSSFVRSVAPQGAVLVGTANGGGICLSVAARYPELVHALVLVDAAIIGRLIETETSQLRCPTLIIWQQDDLIVPPAHARILAARIPGSELRLFPGDESRDDWAGHTPYRLWPVEFEATVLDFLARVEAQRGVLC